MFDDIDVESEQIRKELEEAEGTRERVIDPVFALKRSGVEIVDETLV